MNPIHRTFAFPIFLIVATAARADLLVNETFSGYTGTNLAGNAATGAGLTGNWSGSGFFKNQPTSLTMAGVSSSGGSLALNEITVSGKTATVAFTSPLPTTTLFGSYLFSTTIADTNGRTVGGLGVGAPGDTDNTASFVWSGNGYNNIDGVEGPEIRAEGTLSFLPDVGFTLVSGQTYILLFEFNGEAATNSAWVLNESQLTNFYGSLDSATLAAATSSTEDPSGVVWKGSITGPFAAGPMSNLLLFGYTPNAAGNIVYKWDEIRFSNDSLLESAKGVVPAPSVVRILSVSGGPGGFTITYDSAGENVDIHRSSPGLDNFMPIATGQNSGIFTDSGAPQGKAFYRIETTK